MTVLIFLDIDGVMVPAKSWKGPELMEDGFPSFSSKAVSALKSLISEHTTVLLTTSHKARYSMEEWKRIFAARGVDVVNIGSLEENINNVSRKDELLNWFHTHTTEEEFLIIDDDKSLNALPGFLKDHLILTNAMIGLTEEHLPLANAIGAQLSAVQ